MGPEGTVAGQLFAWSWGLSLRMSFKLPFTDRQCVGKLWQTLSCSQAALPGLNIIHNATTVT